MPSADELVQLVHRYHPAGIESCDTRYDLSPENSRLRALLTPAREELEAGRRDTRWAKFVQRLCQEFPGCIVWDTTPPLSDPCHSCRIYLPWVVMGSKSAESVVALISLLAPVYAIYASREGTQDRWVQFPPLPADFQDHETRLAALIEDEYGFVRLPNDVLFTPVPDLVPWTSNLMLGEATLIDCLLTHHRW